MCIIPSEVQYPGKIINDHKGSYSRTTTYDRRSGGFVTSVSTEDVNNDDDDDENDNEEQKSNDAEKLILSQDTYNTLTRSTNKKTVSFYNASSSMKRKMSSSDTQSKESFIHG